MRQIHVCAWLLVTSLAAAACSGEKFTADEQSSAPTEATGDAVAGTSSRNHAGAASSGGSLSLSSSGKSASAGSASVGGASGVTTSGGSSSASGSSTGGQYSVGGASPEECPIGSITFRMLPGAELEKDFLCDAGCGTGWLTITDAEGATAFSIFSACGTASCESCQMLACAGAACLPTPLSSEGSQLVWTGTYLSRDTCGANMACQRQACVKPGKYKAKACAAINGGASSNGSLACTPKNEQLCAEAEFEFPATATVKLVLQK